VISGIKRLNIKASLPSGGSIFLALMWIEWHHDVQRLLNIQCFNFDNRSRPQLGWATRFQQTFM
jgi:hypothetical protein